MSLQGRVEIQRGEAGAWTAASLDDQLCIGDGIRLGRLARAALALANDSVLKIDQLTTMRLAGEPESGRSLLDLLFGDVHFFSHRPRALEIATPIANAGAEGTEFAMRVRPDRTEVIMFEGRVRLQTPEGELLLASGDAAVARAGAAPRPEIIVRPRDAVAWALYYPPILAPLAERRAAPSALPSALQQAILRVAANDYAGAIAALDAVPEAARDARYYSYRAGVLLNVGRAEAAAQDVERALALDPDAADALAERAVIAVVQNRRAEALADARRAVELAPDSAPARIALSYAQQASFDLEAARATFREAAARTPEDALVQARLAEIELSFGDLDAAQATAARAVALAPELERTQMVLGFAALTRIDLDRRKDGVRARDPAGFGGAARAARPRARQDPRGRSRGRPARARDRGRPRSRRLAAPELPRQGLFRGEARSPGRAAIRDRQAARSERPHPLVLRRDSSADHQPAGRGAAQHREVDRAERQPRGLPLAPLAR